MKNKATKLLEIVERYAPHMLLDCFMKPRTFMHDGVLCEGKVFWCQGLVAFQVVDEECACGGAQEANNEKAHGQDASVGVFPTHACSLAWTLGTLFNIVFSIVSNFEYKFFQTSYKKCLAINKPERTS